MRIVYYINNAEHQTTYNADNAASLAAAMALIAACIDARTRFAVDYC